MKFVISRESAFEKCGFDEDQSDTKEANTLDAAVILEQIERWGYLRNEGATDAYAVACIETGEPDTDVFVARDEAGVVYKVTIQNTPIAVNIHATDGQRVTWTHAVVGVEIIT